MTARRALSGASSAAAIEPPRAGRTSLPPERLLVGLGAIALLVFACWRVTLGVSLSDDAHVVALAWRMSLGDEPLSDEMNLQVLGSVLAVPFTWLWTHVFGLSGLMIASRLWFVAMAAATGALAYRALRSGVAPIIAAAAVTVPLLVLPYNLLVVSYNSVPVLALVLATAAGFAAITRSHAGWGGVSGAATAIGISSLPQLLPGAVFLAAALLLLAGSSRIRLAVVGGVLSIMVPFIVWGVAGPGLEALRRTIAFTNQYQAQRAAPAERLTRAVAEYASHVATPQFWPMWAAALLAAIPFVPRALRAAAIALVPLFAAVPSVIALADVGSGITFGKFVGTYAWVLDLALVAPVTVWALQRRDRSLLVLLALSVPTAVVQVPVIAALTSSNAAWGVHALGAASMTMAVIAGWLQQLREVNRFVGICAGAAVVVTVAALMSAKPFYDPFPWQMTARIGTGPFAGISTTPARAAQIDVLARMGQRHTEPGDGVLFYGGAGVYLLTEGSPVTHVLWLSNFGAANEAGVQYFTRTGQTPDIVFVSTDLVTQAGGPSALATEDPLAGFIFDNYQVVDDAAGGGQYLAMRRA